MYRNNVLNIKVVVDSSIESQQEPFIYIKDLLKLQKNFKKYLKVKPQINVLFKDNFTTANLQSSTAITEFYETGMYIRILAQSDETSEIRIYDIEISSNNIRLIPQTLTIN